MPRPTPSSGGSRRTAGRHRIQVKVIQPQLGLVLVYAGHFDYRLEPYPGGVAAPGYLPGHARPDGWESRV